VALLECLGPRSDVSLIVVNCCYTLQFLYSQFRRSGAHEWTVAVPWIKTRLLFGSVISLLRRADRPPRPIRTACKFMQDPELPWQKVVSMYVRNVFGAIVHGDTRWGSSLMGSYLPCACARGKDIIGHKV
jgi:hypothetical protein